MRQIVGSQHRLEIPRSAPLALGTRPVPITESQNLGHLETYLRLPGIDLEGSLCRLPRSLILLFRRLKEAESLMTFGQCDQSQRINRVFLDGLLRFLSLVVVIAAAALLRFAREVRRKGKS